MDKKRFWLILVIFHLLFFGKQIFFGNSMLQDSREYLYAADNLLQHQTLYSWNLNHAFNPNWLTKRPFLYPSILAAIKLISFGSIPVFFTLLYLVQNLLSLFSIRLILKIAEKHKIKLRFTQLILFLLFSVSQVIYANMVMSEIWLQCCMTGIVYILIMRPNDSKHIFYISLLLIAGMSLKPVLIFTIFCWPLYLLIRSFRHLQIKHLALSLLPLCFYLSVCKMNEQRSGYFHYSSISNINLLHYNTFSLLLNKYGLQKADSIVDNINIEAKTQGNYKAQQEYIRKACKKQISQHMLLYVWLHTRGAIYCVADPGRFDLTQFFNLPHHQNMMYETNKEGAFKSVLQMFLNPLGILLFCLVLFNLFRLYIMLRFTFKSGITWLTKLTILFFPAYILFFTGPIGTSRFYMPFIPLVLLMFLFTMTTQKE